MDRASHERPPAAKRIADAFQSYVAAVYPAGVGEQQRQEVERGFFAGAQALLGLVMDGMTADAEPTDSDLRMVDGIVSELQAYVASVHDQAPATPTSTAPSADYRVPVADEVKAKLNEFGRRIKAECPPGWGFALLMFTYGEGGSMVWLSSAERQDMLKALQEFLRSQAS